MNIFEKIKKTFASQKYSNRKEAPVVYYNGLGYQVEQKTNYSDLVKEGYSSNAIVYRCINEIANASSRVDLNLFRGRQEVEEHEILKLLENPNPTQGKVEFLVSVISYLLISGNSYILRSGPENKEPTELYPLRPDRIKIEPSTRSIPAAYNYVVGGQTQNRYEIDQATGDSQVKQIKLFNPSDDYYGLSPIQTASIDIDSYNLANKHNVNLLSNGARPSGAVIFNPKDDSGGSMQLSDVQRNQLVNDINQRFSGVNNAGKPMLLEGDFDWKEMGLSPKEMDFLEFKNMSAKDIALIFGVPSQLIGIKDTQTYSNFSEAKLALYNETIIPLLDRLQSDLNEWLTPQFGSDLYLKFDYDSIPAIAEQRKRVFESVIGGVQNGILTRNEARHQLGFDSIKGADELLVPSNLMPLSFAEQTDEDVKPPEVVDEREEEAMQVENQDDDTDELVKAISDINTTPTDSMVSEAKKGLAWRKEFGRGGTQVGATRANQIINKVSLSPSTVRRMFSFFSRHEVDKQGQGFSQGEDGYPSAGRIAWALWGGDAGFSWSRKVRNQLDRERDKFYEIDIEEKQVTAAVKKGLQKKVEDHNEKHGDKAGKKVTLRMLSAVFKRGIGAYRTNPGSVRPTVTSEEQWAYARVNAFLYAVRSGRFKGGKFDLDLLPSGHPLAK